MDSLLPTILHINMQDFPAAVERMWRPELVGKPVIVGRPRGNTSGVVMSASAESRKLGVEEGMSVRQARRACPDAVVVHANVTVYEQVFEKILDILVQYSPLVEPDSLESAYVDVTASRNLFGNESRIAGMISYDIFEQLRMPARIGCGHNRLLARVASSAGKPFAKVRPGFESMCLAGLPVGVLECVSGKIEKRLSDLGVSVIGELAAIPERLLVRQFGPVGALMKSQAEGRDSCLVKAAYPPDVIKIEHMFEQPAEEPAEVEERMKEMVADAWGKLRKRNALAGEATLSVESGEVPQPSTLNSQPMASFHFKKPTDSPSHIFQVLCKLLESIMRPGMEVSGVRIVLSEITDGESSQLCLIGIGERRSRLERTMSLIRERFGDGALVFGSSLAPTGGARVLARVAM